MRSSLRSFLNVAFETVPMFVWLTMALSRPFKEDRLANENRVIFLGCLLTYEAGGTENILLLHEYSMLH